jgi:BirA family biotin operon repressor/biotin-[acetyl-CoA-carboxylase] ligase
MTPTLHRVETTGSTNEDLHALAEDGAPDGTTIVAEAMSHGRGSRGRDWHAPRGGLWFSLLRRPSVAIETGVLSLRVGLALAPILDRLVGQSVMLKWPNDLMLGDRKLGGILCEMRWQGDRVSWVVIGVGINVRNPAPEGLRKRATSLTKHVPGITVADVLEAVLPSLRKMNVDQSELTPSDLAAFRVRDWLNGRQVARPVEGKVEGIDVRGGLEVVTHDGVRRTLLDAELVLA